MQLSLEKNLLSIDNYKQIFVLDSDLIQVKDIKVVGEKFKVLYLDGYKIVIQGIFKNIQLGDIDDELQNNYEKK
ncbi:TPA: hypothetical protein IAA91_01535 [Candidatus Avacholeplasma faecigallinarum]|nr:hypothetical protein [Candidatus Avacholeplasma faecigallinarum]